MDDFEEILSPLNQLALDARKQVIKRGDKVKLVAKPTGALSS